VSELDVYYVIGRFSGVYWQSRSLSLSTIW